MLSEDTFRCWYVVTFLEIKTFHLWKKLIKIQGICWDVEQQDALSRGETFPPEGKLIKSESEQLSGLPKLLKLPRFSRLLCLWSYISWKDFWETLLEDQSCLEEALKGHPPTQGPACRLHSGLQVSSFCDISPTLGWILVMQLFLSHPWPVYNLLPIFLQLPQ